MNFNLSYGSTRRDGSRRKLQSSNLGKGLSGGRTPGCGESRGVGSGVCAFSTPVTNRHRARTAKQHAGLIGEAFFKIVLLFVMTGAQLFILHRSRDQAPPPERALAARLPSFLAYPLGDGNGCAESPVLLGRKRVTADRSARTTACS